MPVEVKCPTCGHSAPVTDAQLGKLVKCPECQEVFRASPTLTPKPTPRQPPARPPTSSARPARPRATSASTEPPYFAAALRAADIQNQVVGFLASLGGVGCILLLLAGVASGQGVAAFVVAVLAGVQLVFVAVGSMLVVNLTKVLVGLGRDVRVIRRKSGKGERR